MKPGLPCPLLADLFAGPVIKTDKKVHIPVNIQQKTAAAAPDTPADILFINGKIINVFTGEIHQHPVAVRKGIICGFDARPAATVVDLKGDFMAPGFMDSHVHIESAMVLPGAFARAVLPCGTTTAVADPHEIANVLGAAGIDYMMQAAENLPMNLLFALPSCVPATHLETAGATLDAAALTPFFQREKVCALAEMMNYPGVVNGDPSVMAKLEAARRAGRVMDGHAPGLTGTALRSYAAAGIGSDHECTTAPEAMEKLSLGMHIMVREGTGAKNLEDLMPAITDHTWSRMMWCTDDRHTGDILTQGHVDHIIRKAIALGLSPIRAIQMATINCARYFNLKNAGAIAPGRRADLVIFRDLEKINIHQVYAAGILVAESGRPTAALDLPRPAACPAAIRLDLDKIDFSIPVQGAKVRVIQVIEDQVITGETRMAVREKQGLALADPQRDMAKIAVIERYSGNTGMATGFVTGMGLEKGALAASVAHDSHNIIVTGVSDPDMKTAVTAVVEMGGGFSVVRDGKVLATVPLPAAGLMSLSTASQVHREMESLLAAARTLGTALKDPFMTLGFLALPVIPSLKITDKGLVDVNIFQPVDLFLTQNTYPRKK